MKAVSRKTISALLCVLLAVCPLCTGASAPNAVGTVGAIIDTDGSDGYSGDYVVIYNPSTEANVGYSTGSIGGLIMDADSAEPAPFEEYEADVTPALLAKYLEACSEHGAFEGRSETTEYHVGDTLVYRLNDYSPAGDELEFKVLAVGEHCYVWTPSGEGQELYPLDGIDADYAQQACDNFDSCYPLVMQYIGSYTEGVKINLLYYNIQDGWQQGGPYISGFFSPADCYSNHRPMISLDTYPGVYYPLEDGGWESRLSRSFGIAVHEYQHMINFLTVGNMDVWLNEALSSATEELCYPGSCLAKRLPGWLNCASEEELISDPQAEYEYEPAFEVHNGASLYRWDDTGADIGAVYGLVTLFAQYLYSHYGNGVFKQIIQNYSSCGSAVNVLSAVTGTDTARLVRSFRIALTANDRQGEYSFAMQPGYDPNAYGGVDNLYELLAPVVYTGQGLTVYGGGAVTVKPVNGTYYPPADAEQGLEYIGVTVIHGLKGDVDLDGDVDTIDALMVLRFSLDLIEFSPVQFRLGDVNSNGAVNGSDALAILRYILGLSHEL